MYRRVFESNSAHRLAMLGFFASKDIFYESTFHEFSQKFHCYLINGKYYADWCIASPVICNWCTARFTANVWIGPFIWYFACEGLKIISYNFNRKQCKNQLLSLVLFIKLLMKNSIMVNLFISSHGTCIKEEIAMWRFPLGLHNKNINPPGLPESTLHFHHCHLPC